MTYSVRCECGEVQTVSATQAGSTIQCSCARTISVPRLSQLRVAAGENSVPQSAVERVQAMIHRGELPTGNICPLTGRPANCVVYVNMQCEQKYVRKIHGDSSVSLLPLLFGGVVGHLLALLLSQRPAGNEVLGRDTWIDLPLRISSDAKSKFLRCRQSKLKSLLQQTPAYAELLKGYPHATLRSIA